MKRGFIGKMLDLAERTIQNCGFGMFLQKKDSISRAVFKQAFEHFI